MSNYINQDTDFSNVVITNDYVCLVGGTWTASLQDGKTVYVSSDGTQTIDGPVNLIGANLIISAGAVVDNAVVVGSTSNASPTITVQTGGTLENSDVFNGKITIASGGISSSNNYVAEAVTLSSGSESDNDTFYNPGTTGSTSGTLNLSQLPTGTATNFTTSSKTSSFSTAKNITILNPNFPNISANNTKAPTTGYQIFRVYGGSEYGSSVIAQESHTDYSNRNFTLSNDYPSYSGGTWTASLVDGKTVYSNSSGTVTNVEGPINLIAISSLTINAGAVVDGITVTGNTTPTIYNNGTIQNSFVSNGYLRNGSTTTTGISRNNTYISEITYSYSGSSLTNDYFYEPGSSYATYNLTNMPSGVSTTFHLGDGAGNIVLYANSIFNNSYVETASSSTVYIYQYNGTTITNTSEDVVCFVSGTLIHTINGPVAVEKLNIGDQVITHTKEGIRNRAITWIGYNHVVARSLLSEDQAGYPVRILKNAIADGVPYKDLLVTAEHCLFFNDQFIPARMLVNNYSIFYDRSITEYTYYHIETEDHSVITADGMLTESYLDTGNRRYFKQTNKITNIYSEEKSWCSDSAYPLVVARQVVEPIHQQLTKRATKLGCEYKGTTYQTTEDSDLHLVTDKGEVINTTYQGKGCFSFVIPPRTDNVRLVSRTSQPNQVIGSFVDDRRHLGVLVGNITILEKNTIRQVNDHLAMPNLMGWDVNEQGPCRWTNGNALIQLKGANNDNIVILAVQVLASGPYIIQPYEDEEKIAVNQ